MHWKIVVLILVFTLIITSLGLITPKQSDKKQIFGCTKPIGDNFNPNATIDDGSCIGSVIGPNGQIKYVKLSDSK
mgnify:CR=1 FL=1